MNRADYYRWLARGFQSIGVTKDWRLLNEVKLLPVVASGFQSIGVTKDWRPVFS